MTAVRARVLCPDCHGENDDHFRYCQWCAIPSNCRVHGENEQHPLDIDEKALTTRFQQFSDARAEQRSGKRRTATAALFSNFLMSRKNGDRKSIEEAQPIDAVEFLCWLDSSGQRRRTAVHARDCEAVGTPDLSGCSSEHGACSLRYAHDSLRSNYVSKLAVVFEKELGVTSIWSDTLRVGNPVRSDLVAQYMAFSKEEQKKAGVMVKQAPALLHSHLAAIIAPLRVRLQLAEDAEQRVTLARDIAIFTVAFSTTKRGDELTRTLIQRILRLPNRSGFMFNFQWGKTLRDGADHLLTVPYNEEYIATCPVRAVEEFVRVGAHVGWDMTKGYLFPTVSPPKESGGPPVRGSQPLSAKQMSQILKRHAKKAGEHTEFSMHSFRSGGAVSRALAGDSMSTIMQRAFWKNPRTAFRYMRLMEVVSPGAEGVAMVEGISEDQYREFNEFPLSEQSRSWAAFGNNPML